MEARLFTIRWTRESKSQYDELRIAADSINTSRRTKGKAKSSKQEGLFRQVHKTIQLLAQNPRHVGLRTHEYSSPGLENPFDSTKKIFEAYAQNKTPGAYRVFWCYGPKQQELTIIAITPHP